MLSFAATAESIDRILRAYCRRGLFSGSALVAERGEIIYKQSFGLADRAWLLPNKPETAFMLGSNTKQFTAMLLLQLVEKGIIAIHHAVDQYLPYFRKDLGQKISMYHLLTHTSGLPNYNAALSFRIDERYAPYTNEKMITEFTRGDLEFEPGTKFSYCNTGYYILGDIIERATGCTYEEVLKENIIEPLSLENTGFFNGSDSPLGLSNGYVLDENGIHRAEPIHPRYGYSSGNVYASVDDLYRWDRALYSEELISKKYLDAMFTPYLNNYAFGWVSTSVRWAELEEFFIDPLHYHYARPERNKASEKADMIVHRGMTYGYESLIIRIVDRQQFVVLLSNNVGRVFMEEIGFKILNAMHNLKLVV